MPQTSRKEPKPEYPPGFNPRKRLADHGVRRMAATRMEIAETTQVPATTPSAQSRTKAASSEAEDEL